MTALDSTIWRLVPALTAIVLLAGAAEAQTSGGAQPAAPPAPAHAAAPAPANTPPTEALTTLPMGKGLPVIVRAGVFFVGVDSIDENEGAFTATVDLRLRWVDLRLRYAPAEAPQGFKEQRGAAAEARLAEIWSPDVALANMKGEPEYQARGLRVYPDGRVELLQRTTATFATDFDVERFPFDRQKLRVELVSRLENANRVDFDFQQDDLDFSRVAPGVEVGGWATGLVDVRREPAAGWYGDTHSRLWAALEVRRLPGTSLAPIFIPLFASLLIPLLAIWLNRVEDGVFQIEAFELANVIIGGLFAVIALNFTIYAEYTMLSSADNLVTRLFGLNYLTLAISLITNVVLFRFGLVERAFGKYVQEQVYLFLVWAVPVLALVCSVAVLLVALV